ncbi:hypothetical protein FACS189454_09520 [Planctomycetales bacterium]|nr:hypothetical protein FACS189454_09520 [Planctomycetales bacterium]
MGVMVGVGGFIGGVTGTAMARQRQMRAIQAFGSIVRVEAQEFQEILDRSEDIPLVVHATSGWFTTTFKYLTNYKGIFFYTKSPEELPFRREVELVKAAKMVIPFQ